MKKQKISRILTFVISAPISLVLSWFIIDSLLLAIVFTIAVILGIFYIQKAIDQKNSFFHNIDSAYNFVNLMNIQMLSTNSLYEAYKSIENYVDVDFSNIDNNDLHIQLHEIANEYNLNSFKMYVNTMQIYDNDGGDYKKMQEIPTSLCLKCKSYYHKLNENKFIKLVEVTSLFLLWICILVFLRLSIPTYYSLMMESLLYQIIMLLVLFIGSLCYYFTLIEYLKNKIRGI